jgi:myosin heavy subunit
VEADADELVSLVSGKSSTPKSGATAGDGDKGGGSDKGRLGGRRKNKKPSVVRQFKTQLTELMEYLNATSPFYIRCIKPMDSPQLHASNSGGASCVGFDEKRVVEQLQCSGALEAIRISRSGYPYRMSHHQFYQRYRLVANLAIPNHEQSAAPPGTDSEMLINLTSETAASIKNLSEYTHGKCDVILSMLRESPSFPAFGASGGGSTIQVRTTKDYEDYVIDACFYS